MARRAHAVVALALLAGLPARADDVDLDRAPPSQPTIEDLGYFLSKLDEWAKSRALNVLADLAADSRLDRGEVARVLRELVDSGPPPDEFGYRGANGFQRRLSALLRTLRLKGPIVEGPPEGAIVLALDESFVGKLSKSAEAEVGGSVPGLVQALRGGYDLRGNFSSYAHVRYHEKGGIVDEEPAFFTSGAALAKKEGELKDSFDAWELAKWACIDPPRSKFDAGFIVMYFDPRRACGDVRIPTAGDTEDPDFRPTPESEPESGRTCGGAPQWVCKNIPLSAATRFRYVPNSPYLEAMGSR
jgi:hypothetical protein